MAAYALLESGYFSRSDYPFGAHGVLIAAPLSALLWCVLALPFVI